MVKIEKFTDLNTWKESHKLVLYIYHLTKNYPKSEMLALANQMQRATVSVTSNIAEGFGRHTFKDKCHLYYQSRGSLIELRNQLIISRDLLYITETEYIKAEELADTSQKLLHGLIAITTKNSRY